MFINSAHAANTEAGHGEVQMDYPGHFPPFDPATYSSTLLWLAITFGLFYFLMNRIVVPRISGILEVRRDRISQDLDEANRMKEDSDTAHAAYEHELAEARAKAQSIANEATEKAKAEADAERHKVEEELAEKLKEAEAKISEIKAKAMAEVDTIAGDITGDIVQSMSGAKATKAEITSAVKAVVAGN